MNDETNMPFCDVPTRQESKVWVFEDDPMPTMVTRQRAMKKVIFRSTGLIKAIKLEGQKTVTANWYTTKCFPEILQEVNVRGLIIHHDSASFHTVGLTAEFLKQKQVKGIEHPPYSPDLAMCDFCLFINLKKTLRGRRFHSEDIDGAINAFFHQFQEMNGFRHLICGKFVAKSASMLEETTLNTPKIL
ncbi:histone-lysine N-methyltransferase SETMAR [Trichonephila clavipes]|nr:histone-lysine N-methyltransferase SETMAR [Trichonephila clavipes]